MNKLFMSKNKYQHGGNIHETKGILYDFSANLNPLGMPENVKAALKRRVKVWEHYPDPQCSRLINQLSLWEGVPGRWIACGNGSADLIFRLALADQPHRALVLAPTFTEYEKALCSVGCEIVHHELLRENQFQVTEKLLDEIDESMDMVVLCNPNNPTGQLIAPELIGKVVDRCCRFGIRLLLDECSLDFVKKNEEYSGKRYLSHCANLVILKTFSKIFAMPGIRLGYVMSSDNELLHLISEIGQAWSVSSPAETAGMAAMAKENIEYVDQTQNIIEEERLYLEQGLRQLGMNVIPSQANFILFQTQLDLKEPLKRRSILIRSGDAYVGLSKDYYRVAIRSHQENEILLAALADIMANGK